MIALAIVLTGIGSYAMRAFFIFALARYAFPPILLRALEYVAPTVMAALVISMLTTPLENSVHSLRTSRSRRHSRS